MKIFLDNREVTVYYAFQLSLLSFDTLLRLVLNCLVNYITAIMSYRRTFSEMAGPNYIKLYEDIQLSSALTEFVLDIRHM